jgi:hypothetical protein
MKKLGKSLVVVGLLLGGSELLAVPACTVGNSVTTGDNYYFPVSNCHVKDTSDNNFYPALHYSTFSGYIQPVAVQNMDGNPVDTSSSTDLGVYRNNYAIANNTCDSSMTIDNLPNTFNFSYATSGDGTYCAYIALDNDSKLLMIEGTLTGTTWSNGSVTAVVFNTAPTDITLSSNTLAENAPVGTTIGTLSATDTEDGALSDFSLSCATAGTNDGNFTIVGTTLKSNYSFDYETTTSQSVCVRVKDSANATYDKLFTIAISDVNENTGGGGSEPEVTHTLGDVEASSELEGTTTQTDPQTNDVSTTLSTTNDDSENVEIEVVAKSTGEVKAIHSLKVGTKETKAESELSNTKTTIKADKSVETQATLSQNGSEIKVVAKADGSASHEVKLSNNTTSLATSDIKGAKTYITQEGEVQTSVEPESYTDANGCSVRAVILTDKDGKSRSEFVKVCNDAETEQPTVSGTTPFEAGNTIRVYEDAEDANRLKLQIQTPITKRLQF